MCDSLAYSLLLSENQICNFRTVKLFSTLDASKPFCPISSLLCGEFWKLKVVRIELFPLSLLIKIHGVIVAVRLFSMVWGWICLGFFCNAVFHLSWRLVPLFIWACYPLEVLGKINRLNKYYMYAFNNAHTFNRK